MSVIFRWLLAWAFPLSSPLLGSSNFFLVLEGALSIVSKFATRGFTIASNTFLNSLTRVSSSSGLVVSWSVSLSYFLIKIERIAFVSLSFDFIFVFVEVFVGNQFLEVLSFCFRGDFVYCCWYINSFRLSFTKAKHCMYPTAWLLIKRSCLAFVFFQVAATGLNCITPSSSSHSCDMSVKLVLHFSRGST